MAAQKDPSPTTAILPFDSIENGVHSKASFVEDSEVFDEPSLSASTTLPETNGYKTKAYDVHTSEPGGPQSNAQAQLDSYVYSGSLRKFPRISRPVELLRHEYDVVVIGSGYGGGVAASRMARGKQSVCVLELGKERWPGEYPSNLAEATPELHVSGDFAPNDKKSKQVDVNDPTGLYHLVLGEGQNAFVANGLGGTSLLNANVFLRADHATLGLDYWPLEIRKDPRCLEKYYRRAESVLQPEAYPESFPDLPKLDLLKRQAEALGVGNKFYRVPQTTRFQDGPNSTGVEMQSSALTGNDSTGINDGSKSSTLVNYLSDAWNWGAEIFCECEVRYIKKDPTGNGYLVFFAWHGSKRGAFKKNIYSDLMWIHAKKFVFLGAGTLGTTQILLRSKQMGLKMSDNVGTGMSGNGDILAFGYNTDFNVNAIGRAFPSPDRPIGPTINGVIDCRDQLNPLDGYVIEEGAVPEALAPILRTMLEAMPGKIYPQRYGLIEQLRHLLSHLEERSFGPYVPGGSIERTQIYLIMSHDSNQAIMTLKNDKPVLQFLGVGRSEHVAFLNQRLAEATSAVGGTYINSPFFAALGQQEITVHPIGGANLSSDGTTSGGATSHVGEVLTGDGRECHDGLICCDGSVVPLALGVNPFATITALAERSVEAAARKKQIDIDYDTTNGVLDLFGPPSHSIRQEGNLKHAEKIIDEAQAAKSEGVTFTEVMEGFIYIGDEIEDFTIASNVARAACNSARFYLSAHAWNTDTFVSRDDHSAILTGTFTCGALSKDPFMVLQGNFQLFNDDPRAPDTKNLTYDFDMVSTDGEKIHFHGYKIVDPSVAFSPLATWKATSTLYVTLTRTDRSEAIVGRGILLINPAAFGSELATFNSLGSSLFAKARSSGQFLTYFAKQVAGVFLSPFNALQYPKVTTNGYFNKRPPTATYKLTASDGVPCLMHMWSPTKVTTSPPVQIFFIPGAAVDHQIFALPTIKTNAIEYFTSAGYQAFCITHRVGKTMVAQKNYTTFDARLDIQAALIYIRSLQASSSQTKIYVVAHCAGSIALSMALLDGTVPASWISGITASNVFMNPIFGTVNRVKATLPLPLTTAYRLLVGNWFSTASSHEDTYVQQMLNQVLRFYPTGATSEICNSVVCHRCELVFGRLWTHRNLNAATHANLSHFLGGTSMASLSHLMAMGTTNHVLTNNLAPLDTPANIARLRGIPVFLFSGSENVVYSPETTDVSYGVLRDRLGSEWFERRVFEGRGHLDCWMGEEARKGGVWPAVRGHVERFGRG